MFEMTLACALVMNVANEPSSAHIYPNKQVGVLFRQ